MRRAQSLGRSSSPVSRTNPHPSPRGRAPEKPSQTTPSRLGPGSPAPVPASAARGLLPAPRAHTAREGGRLPPPPPHPAAGRSPRPNGPGNSSRPCSASEVSRGTGHGAPLHRPAPRSRRRLPSAAALRRRLNERPPPAPAKPAPGAGGCREGGSVTRRAGPPRSLPVRPPAEAGPAARPGRRAGGGERRRLGSERGFRGTRG